MDVKPIKENNGGMTETGLDPFKSNKDTQEAWMYFHKNKWFVFKQFYLQRKLFWQKMAVSGLGSEKRFFLCFLSLAISGLEKEAHKTEEELKHARLLTHEKMEKEEKRSFFVMMKNIIVLF